VGNQFGFWVCPSSWRRADILAVFWLPTLDTFRTFLSDSNPNYSALTNLVCAKKAPDLEVLHG
jgi:hypothetical protein